jgi:hypothetical protein
MPISIADPRGTALVVHVERFDARGRFLVLMCARPQSNQQRLNALTMLQFPISVFVESGPIAISC